ncbi:hypothetical protein FA95DRAFT_708926 [Auriscalpium vulgare]|uniref:Uncharacterized protein n=1 Tax=Auriscalpium vulgare TaxID=40419 RepID=A0ACB8RB88_9AGAM|nr:hypothetical protein FA95DRAFT_708926 [Auriscalpium vulgare]
MSPRPVLPSTSQKGRICPCRRPRGPAFPRTAPRNPPVVIPSVRRRRRRHLLSAAASPYRPPVQLPPVNVNKPVPAFSSVPSSKTDSEPDAPAVYLPQLVQPTMFLPIPNVRRKYFLDYNATDRRPTDRPPDDAPHEIRREAGEAPQARPHRGVDALGLPDARCACIVAPLIHRNAHAAQMTNSWRVLARRARDRIVEAGPEDLPVVLNVRPCPGKHAACVLSWSVSSVSH